MSLMPRFGTTSTLTAFMFTKQKKTKKKIYNVQMKGEHFSQSTFTDLSLDYRENTTSQTEQQIPPLSSQSL